MGQPKQLLPYGELTLLETVIERVLVTPMSGLAVVTNAAVAEALDLTDDPRFLTVLNDDPESQMLDSIRRGAEALQGFFGVPPDAGLMVCPGDMPDVDADTVHACIRAFGGLAIAAEREDIVVAAHEGKRGHPIIVPWALTAELADIREGGLAQLLARYPERVHLVERPSAGVTRDIDTPEDYLAGAGG